MNRWRVRPAEHVDIGVIARHRSDMFKDMGRGSDQGRADLVVGTQAFLATHLGVDYFAWVCVDTESGKVAGTGGYHLRQVPPRLNARDGAYLTSFDQPIILGMYTEPEFRRHGVATLILEAILDDCRKKNYVNVVLHASEEGRHLYERFGFEDSHEMRLWL